MQLAKWGNSYAIRLPKEMVEAINAQLGDELDITVQYDGSLRIRRKMTREEAIEGLSRFQGWMPEDFKFDRDEANAR